MCLNRWADCDELVYINTSVITLGADFRVEAFNLNVIVYRLNLEYDKHESECVWAAYGV